ncbi:TP53-binding protein 1 isoform X2 [Alosa sapidissima]|uniref:TP53-binding protein 1 isoform X2 n=1 Tax=Alosa sapidissima TaxID=34773 RepID=UPI001C08B7DF|nr:TP53-binding protein 1 isoform X2 [Alosa sapidissima]
MDPSGSELDSSLPQPENPCLIVEDSQPDSLAPEDDPESSYRALLAKRLSNLQPHAPSPVLELISSPPRDRLSQKESQASGNHNNHSVSQEPDQSLEVQESSPVFDIVTSGDPKRSDMEDVDSGADSTTCAQTEESMSQFGLLELSESQGFRDQPQKSESMSQFGLLELSESQGFRDQPQKSDNTKTTGRNSQNQDLRRSEVSSSSRESQRLSIQALLHSQATEDEDMVSSQEDMFEGEEGRAGTCVDSTVNEPVNCCMPTSTPANSLHLLHLSGQGTLVQESLSQQSVDFVAATQERMSQTPLIVPSSPTGDEPMDISKTEDNQSQRGEKPKGSSAVLKPRPTSTPVSQNSPGFVLDKSLSLPSQPEFSHDIFVATPSLDQPTVKADGASSSQTQNSPTAVKTLPTKPSPTSSPRNTPAAASPKHTSKGAQAAQSSSSQAPEVGVSFQLELSSTSQPSILFQKTQSFLEDADEDSQATQIEEMATEGAMGVDTSDAGPSRAATAASQSSASGGGVGTCGVRPGAGVVGREISRSQPDPHSRPASHNVNVGRALSQGSATLDRAKPSGGGVSQLGRVESSAAAKPSPSPDDLGVVPPSLPSQSLSQSMLSVHSATRPVPDSQRSQPKSQSQSQASSQAASQRLTQHSQPPRSQGSGHSQGKERNVPALEEMVETDKLREEENENESVVGTGPGASLGLCLALSQSQNFDPEPMEEDQDQLETQQLVPGPQHTKAAQASSASPSSPQKSQKVSQQQQKEKDKDRTVTASQPTPGLCSPERRRKELEKSLSPGKGSLSQPERGSRADPGPHRSQSQGLSDSSGDIPFHFTLPKEGELIRPVVTATPPLISQLKKTPRHSTPIEMTSFSEASEGDVTRETSMADSEIMAEESAEEPPTTAEASGKLSLRMKLVTPVEEGSSGSERFSLQKPPLSDDDGSVVKATTVAKAVASPSVFSRVREVHRQEEAEEEVQPSTLSAPLSGGLFNSSQRLGGDSQDSESRPRPLITSTQNSQEAHQSQPLSPAPQRSTVGNGTLGRLSQQANGAASESPVKHAPTGTPQGDAGQSAQVGGAELTPPRTPLRQRAVSQQTSFEVPASTSNTPNKSHLRAVSQQTSFDAAGAHNSSGRGLPELSPPRPPPGVRMRRHVRTTQEVRTTVTRIITDVYYEDGREVDRKVTEESEEPVVDCRVLESDLSPSRTGSSMTSGDLADISSLSSKASSLTHSSSGSMGAAAGAGTSAGRHPDFIMPTGRGAGRSGSPRRGRKQLQRPVSEQARVQGSRPLTPVTPRGRSRRGRPPSRSPQSRGGRAGANNVQRGPFSSPEEEEERFTRVTSRGRAATPPPGPSARAGGASSDSSLVGLRVVAKWSSNGYFYSGRITSDLGAGRFRLLFDDGYECEVQGRDVLLCDPIPTETEVTAISEDEYFLTGVVKNHKTVGRELQYCVEREGQQQWYSRASVILSMEQGSQLREHYGLDPSEPLTPLTKAADISLDNLVDGKRRRRGNTGPGVNTPSRSGSDSPRTPGPSGKRKLMSSTEEERAERTPAKRGRKSGPNKAGSRAAAGTAVGNTSGSDAGDHLASHVCAGARAGAGTGVCNTSGSGTDVPSDPSDLLASHGPLPTSDSLFMGFAFLLTTSSVNDRLSNLATSDEEEDYLPTAPYNKHYIVSQLEAGGGLVLPDFNEEQCKAAYQSLLIADQHCRTRKYLLCVASGVPCVSNAWVRDSCLEQKLLNYRNYLLPAGMGPSQRVVEWHPRCSPFKSLRVLLVFAGSADLWGELLKLSGASSVKQQKGEDTDIPADTFDVMVTERSCPSAVVKRASSRSLPVVSLEWLVQSLIVGERQDYASDPQYRHDYDL